MGNIAADQILGKYPIFSDNQGLNVYIRVDDARQCLEEYASQQSSADKKMIEELQQKVKEQNLFILKHVADKGELKRGIDQLTKERDELQFHFNSIDFEVEKQDKIIEQQKERIERLESLLIACDEELRSTEDYEHGERGKRITKLRGEIQALSQQDNKK
jgi:chromosome segregation ATPase